MPLNTKTIIYINPKLNDVGSKLATYIQNGYESDKISREQLLLVAEHCLFLAKAMTRKQYQDFSGKSKDAHYWQTQYKFLNEINIVLI